MPDQKLCPGCRSTLLSRYNNEPVCGPCQRALRESSVSTPAWLWDTPPMRRALAELNFSGVLALLRSAAGLTQQQMADLVPGWTKTKVARAESGERGTLYDIRELLAWADALCVPREALLPLVLGTPDAALYLDSSQESQEGEELNRRTFSGGMLALTASTLLPDGVLAPARIDRTHVAYLQTCADQLWARDWSVGGASLLRNGLHLFARAKPMLNESDYTERVGLDLLRTTADLGNCTSFLAFDAGQPGLARRLAQEAAMLADSGDDPELRAHVYATVAMQSTALARVSEQRGPAREALRALRVAAQSAKHHPSPKLHALIDMRIATANALLGDGSAARASIAAAHRELDRGDHPDDRQALGFVRRSEVLGHEARVTALLGDAATAARQLQHMLDTTELAPRNQVYYRAMLAEMQLAAGDTAVALEVGHQTLSDLENVGSMRALRTLQPLARHDTQFHERYGAIANDLSTKVASLA
ncbi:helix-turn-helix domain-containing protein [Actinomadura sp. WMMB 499]|uniref:helix-turn-helix domain-containing protein n=1 Tax=Actinomadura sp. WMMB 499 TaxID=1219491 RepID=UPI001245DF47|nr:helix-turn-helix transcriptional regulator [Actinomadura sp. WMMB 499]QFG22859.1 helix-turn-helix domain-containing protein [Actinomadura sp. WMMB 499]